MKTKLIIGISGFILGALVTFFAFTPQSTEVTNAEGSVKVECPGIRYTSGQIIRAECGMRPRGTCTFEDRGGCEYIMKNVGSTTINNGDQIQVINVVVSRGGSTILDVEHPTG